MKSKLYLLVLSFIFLFTSLNAQSGYVETLYLKNGSIINGIIIEEVLNVKIKIQTRDGNVFEYLMSEVEKITKTPIVKETPKYYPPTYVQQNIQSVNDTSPSPKPIIVKVDYKDFLKTGFTGVTEIGSLFGGYYGDKYSAFSFNQIIGGRTSQHFFIGLGVGVDINGNKGDFKLLRVPVTLDTRTYFIKNRFSPFLNLGPGYAFEKLSSRYRYYNSRYAENYHVFMMNMGIGCEFKISKKIGVSFNIGGRLNVYPHLDNGSTETYGNGFVKFGINY